MTAHSKSRQTVLDRLRSRPVDSLPLPAVDESKLTRFEDPIAKFREMLEFVGGQCHLIERAEQAREVLASLASFRDAKQIASLCPEIIAGNYDASSVSDPHELASIDWVIARGEFLVAENGAIWVDGATLPHRVLLFIPQYLAIVVSRSQVVNQMHEAYARIGLPPDSFGVFVAGPSKTADIEQSLVLRHTGVERFRSS